MYRQMDFARRVDLQKVPHQSVTGNLPTHQFPVHYLCVCVLHGRYAEAILKLLIPVVQKSAPDDIRVRVVISQLDPMICTQPSSFFVLIWSVQVHIRLTPGQENGNVLGNQKVPDHPLKTKAPIDLRLQLMGE